MLQDQDAMKSERAMAAILQMSTPDLEKIKRAYLGQ
jgi:hypothetical protein